MAHVCPSRRNSNSLWTILLRSRKAEEENYIEAGTYTRLDVGTMAVDALSQGVVYVLQPALASRHVVKGYLRV